MTLLVDPRAGSGQFLPLFKALHLPTELCTLHSGDFAFLGLGEGDCPVPVGIERKTLSDFLASMYNGRLPGHQIPKMLQAYQDIWLVIEGIYRIGKDGHVLVPLGTKPLLGVGKGKGKKMVWVDLPQPVMYRELEAMILTLEMKAGVRTRQTGGMMGTAKFVAALRSWWITKNWEGHRSHLRFHSETADNALLVKPSLCRVMASTLPGIGWVKSGAIAERFGSVAAMVAADEKRWEEIDGVGKILAKRIVEAVQVAGWTG